MATQVQEAALVELKRLFRDTTGNQGTTLGYRLLTSCDEGDIESVKTLLNHQEKKSFIDKHDRDNRETPLYIAVKRGHFEIVQLLLEHEADVESLNGKDDHTPLMAASECGHTKIVELLLQYKANVNNIIRGDTYQRRYQFVMESESMQIEYGPEVMMTVSSGYSYNIRSNLRLTALMFASMNRHFTTVNVLLKYGANVNTLDRYGRSALMIASANGYTEIVEVLIEYGADIDIKEINGWSALMLASLSEQIQVVQLLLEHGADISGVTRNEVRIQLKTRRPSVIVYSQYSVLMIVSLNGCVKVAKLLLKCKLLNINMLDTHQRSALMIASAKGHVEIVELLLKHGANVNIQDVKGRSALMLASKAGYITIVELLLEHKANIDMRGADGQSAFMFAITHEHVETAYFLFKYGADVKVRDIEGKWSLILASKCGHTELVKLLLLFGADHDATSDMQGVVGLHSESQSALMAASVNGHSETAKLLLDHGADVDLQNNDGVSALMFASRNGHLNTAKLLLEHGANINLQGRDGLSAFVLACKWFHVEMAKLLVKQGADVNVLREEKGIELLVSENTEIVKLLLQLGANVNMRQAHNGWSALMIAVKNRCYETVKLLLEHGALVNMRNYDGETALMISITCDTEIAKLLLRHGADISDDAIIIASRDKNIKLVKPLLDLGARANAQGNDGWSALLYACWNGDDEIGRLLLDFGADVDIRKRYGVSGLMIASMRGHNNMVGLLLEHGADIDLQDDDGRTALTIACENRRTETAKLLLKSGVNVNLQENDGTSALMIGSRNELTETTELLLQHGADVNLLSNLGLSVLEIANQSGSMRIATLLADHIHGITTNIEDYPAKTTVRVTNSEQHFLWDGFGLNLYVPDNSLPTEVQWCTIEITASIIGDYQLPEFTHLVSAVYSMKCLPKCHFSKSLTLEIQHCTKRENVHKLCFIRSRANEHFQIIQNSQAFFAKHTSYGFIELDKFCQLAIGQKGSDERDYCAKVYRQFHKEDIILNHHRIHFAILWNTDAHNKIADEHYQRNNMILDVDHPIDFEENHIKLDIPYPKGVTTENKEWRIISLTPPVISKKDVDKFKEGRRIPSCQLEAKCEKDEPSDLEHSVKLNGAKEPYNAFTISISARKTRYPSHDVRSAQSGNQRGNREPTYIVLLSKLSEAVSADWEDIGLLLKLSQGSLEVIKSNCPGHAKKCFREMIKLWFKQVDPPPSWAAIIKAIDVLGHETLAKDLSKDFLLYCSS